MKFWRVWWEWLLDYLFPRECLGCGKEGEYLCAECLAAIDLAPSGDCLFCPAKVDTGVCADCFAILAIDDALAAAPQRNSLAAKVVENLKFKFVTELAAAAAKLIDRAIVARGRQQFYYGLTLIPIPLHSRRYAERGFNQSALIAENLKIKYGFSVREDLLIKKNNTKQQAKLNKAERLLNSRDSFAVPAGKSLPEIVVLLDDVLTTGATVAAAAGVLKERGVKKVYVLAVCHGG